MTTSTSYHQAVADNSVHLSAAAIDIPALLASGHHPKAGAIVLFSGETRDNSHGKEVSYLEYEAQESMANKMISEIIAAAMQRWQLNIALAVHRTGKVAVSETAVVVITASAHRSEAYAANRFIIDKIKHEAPIWKCEYFTDGSKEWGGNCNCKDVTGDPHKHIYEFEQQPH
jgi:molybdopterin synthase catalytic subunit